MSLDRMPNKAGGFQTKQEYVYENLKAAILDCTLAPGERLLIDEVAAHFSVSRVPVREALLQLQAEGLVDMQPHVGASVKTISAKSLKELFLILSGLEEMTGAEMSRIVSDKEIDELEGIAIQIDAAIERGDAEGVIAGNRAFHLKTCELAQMSICRELLERAMGHWNRLCHCFLMEIFVPRLKEMKAVHREICQVMRTRDAKAVERAIRAHNEAAYNAYQAYLDEKETE